MERYIFKLYYASFLATILLFFNPVESLTNMKQAEIINLRKFQTSDLPQIYQLYYDTIHCVNAADYTQEQLNAWAPQLTPEIENRWQNSLQQNITYVATIDEQIVGFADMSHAGYLDRLFVHKDFQGKGIAKNLYNALELEAKELDLMAITTESSITAKPFFLKQNFIIINEQQKEYKGIYFTNYLMSKKI